MTPEDLVETEEIERLEDKTVRCIDPKSWDEGGSNA